jgi:alkanesulfonate monooxygenase SsuD/methylene tetrahydromethanopterin reductase-like flavin-dependent oxidoreductase (luciferase family)
MTLLREYTTALSALLRGERATTHGQYVRLDDVALDYPPLIMPGGLPTDDVRTAVGQLRGARPGAAGGQPRVGDVEVFVAVPAESPASEIAATVNEYGAAGATQVVILPAEDDADVARFADVLGREVSPLIAP